MNLVTNLERINRGFGAGGANTNKNGIAFENLTNPENYLMEKEQGFIKELLSKNKNGYYLIKDTPEKTIVYTKQYGFKEYVHKYIDKDISIYRNPDEAYLIKNKNNGKYHLKIVEKKNQNSEGSVEEKLKTGQFNRDEYYLMFEKLNDNITIDYCFVVSDFLQKKFESPNQKYQNIKKINKNNNINIFYANNENYFNLLYNWITE